MSVVFVRNESASGERRVAATPDTVRRFLADGHRVVVERGAGRLARLPDDEYVAAGATLGTSDDVRTADVVLTVRPPDADLVGAMREGASIVGFLWLLDRLDVARSLVARGASAFALDALPRTTRAQKSDALTSQASLAGYKAVVLAAARLPKIFPMQMTPAGTIRPAKVLVIGAGVAGLQAIATARRLGAVVEVSDVRPEVKEQVRSLGATYLEVAATAATGTGGYAAEQGEDFRRRQRELLADRVAAADVVVTTALVPYRPAPRIVTADMVARMRPGSVIVDLAAERGGNVEGTVPGETVDVGGVTIVGELDLAASLSTHASEQYAKNVWSVVSDATKKGVFAWSLADEVVAGALVVHEGEVRHERLREAMGLPPLAGTPSPSAPSSPTPAPSPPQPPASPVSTSNPAVAR
jgi:H+-translocating NAD(P) transhydrogenase subunit alpha